MLALAEDYLNYAEGVMQKTHLRPVDPHEVPEDLLRKDFLPVGWILVVLILAGTWILLLKYFAI